MTFQSEKERLDFIEGHMPLARSVVWYITRYHGYGYYTEEDLTQEALLELTKAVDRYMPELGHSFSTYAFTFIRNNLLRRIKHIKTGWNYETNFIDENFINNIPDNGDSDDSICHNYSEDISNSTLMTAIAALPYGWDYIVVEHDLRGRTFADIANELGLSKQRIHQKHEKALKYLRKALDKHHIK